MEAGFEETNAMNDALEKQLPLATVHGLYHIAVKTENLAATRKFYVDIVGLREFPRPDFGYPGAWLGCSQPGGLAPVSAVYVGVVGMIRVAAVAGSVFHAIVMWPPPVEAK